MNVSVATNAPDAFNCHGCQGKGWVTVGDQARQCPVCGGGGKVPIPYLLPAPYQPQPWYPGRFTYPNGPTWPYQPYIVYWTGGSTNTGTATVWTVRGGV